MGASSTEGVGNGSANDVLRGFDQSHIHKIFIGPLNALKTCAEFKNNKYILRITADDVTFDDSNVSFVANNVQEAIESLTVTLQNSYDNSPVPTIVLDPSIGTFQVKDNSTPLGIDLFTVGNNSSSLNYLTVNDDAVNLQELRFLDGSNYIGFCAPSLTTSTLFILPDDDGSPSQALTTDGSGNLSWTTIISSNTFQDVYDASSPNPEITLDSVAGPIIIRDNAIPLGTDLFTITDNTGTIDYLNVDEDAVSLQELRFPDSGFYVGFTAPTLSASQLWILPDADGLSGQFLRTNGVGTLSWGTAAGGSSSRFSAAFTAASAISPLVYSAGILTVTHGLGEKYCGTVTVFDDGDNVVIPDNITMTSTTITTISLISYHPIPSTWHVTIIA